ncbi:hypothetical protein ACFXKS_14750 [Streptomyces scopuliridis]|uniref:hypothetical protein n=1 Tax=Streptomyces scopuliridis TaxID=452529 RepID=UPI0036A4C192
MSVYVATIEQDGHGHWTASADGLTATGNGYTAARDTLTDALFARDGEEPELRRDRTEVPIPGRAERTPDQLLALVATELPDQAEKYASSLEKARRLDARDAEALAVTAWCVETAGLIVTHRARPAGEDAEPAFVPWTKPAPRAGNDVFLSCWSPHQLDDLPTLTKIADVPRTVLGILDALAPTERVRAWQEMTTAEHGPALDRAMARWWNIAMVMGTRALQHTVKQSTKRLAAGDRGTPATDLLASRALDDLHHDLTDEEQTARRKAWDRSQREQAEARDAREDAYIADLERLLADARQHRDMQLEHRRRRQTVSDARSRIDTPAHEFPIDTGLFARLRDGLPITMHLPARPWRHVTTGESCHFVFTSETEAQLVRVTNVRHYDSIEAFDHAGEHAGTAGTTPTTRQELESYPAQWGGIITLTVTPTAEPVLHHTARSPLPEAAVEPE